MRRGAAVRRLAAAVLLAAAASRALAGADIELGLAATGDPERPRVRHLTESFVPAAEAAWPSESRRPAWQLATGDEAPDQGAELDLLRHGGADVAVVPALDHGWPLWLQNIGLLTPFACGDPAAVAVAVDRLHARFPELERAWAANGLVYLGGGFGLDRFVLMSTRPVAGIGDLKGRRVAAHPLAVEWFRGTGVFVIPGDEGTFRHGLESGTTVAVLAPADELAALGLEDVAPFVADPGIGSAWGGGLAAGRDAFFARPPDLRRALEAGARAYGSAMAADETASTAAALERMAARGAEVTAWTPEATAAWAGALDDIAAEWAWEIDVRDLPGNPMLTAYMAELAATCGPPVRAWTPGPPP